MPQAAREVKATVRFAEYFLEIEKAEGRGKRFWKRKPQQALPVTVPLDGKVLETGVPVAKGLGLVIFGQIKAVEHAKGGCRTVPRR